MPEKYVHTEKGISVLLDTYCFREPLLFLCVCFTHHVFIRPYAVVSPISATNQNCCDRKGNLPALICSKTDTSRGAWRAATVIRKKTTLDKSCLFRHITSQNPFTTKLHEASASTMNKQATRCFGIPLGETLTQTEHFPRQLSSPTSTTCKQTPNVLCHFTNPYSTISP